MVMVSMLTKEMPTMTIVVVMTATKRTLEWIPVQVAHLILFRALTCTSQIAIVETILAAESIRDMMLST